MPSLEELQKKIIAFRDARDWKQFHTPKDLAIGLLLEAGEVAEHFHWKNEEDLKEYIKTHKEEIGDEMGDVLNYLLIMANDFGIDLADATDKKIDKNAQKYPVEKSRGRSAKYTEL
ncbi:MAG: nucleotide pyrophosphohydrolase [Candidatus Magasanikbacteria bacterium RIFOXYD1_FULL_40_23]|uniref:Nucleotide pyrophosphohydrolase n=1 Tax=Candidatus Magasanikbacteria bacterium RIFOXYD1_FULL_40_23 TaxID=1798705 RepID=A0A1F6PAQ8_9BACT|nr:MAG: nucleotide pyrophosphohydrolase [Candidatus Magasanikbacteria bacterium RIFOXYD1_FULL_40_23]